MTAENDIAVVGMSCRFPGSRDIAAFWRNLLAGHEAITWFTREELAAGGIPPDVLDDPSYVPAYGYLPDADLFDADLFEFSPAEAAALDPQQRLLLECGLEALEDAGHGSRTGERVGVFAGTSVSRYLLAQIADPRLRGRLDVLALAGTERDLAATRLAYKLDLTGPALTVQTACSTSLTAVHLAVSALRRGECDAAIAGGASVSVPLKCGYRHDEGGPYSPDGRTRTFDADAAGTVPGNGVGLVVLRRLADALADGDPVRAVIRGSAINNDGREKVGFTAPSPAGQAQVIAAAHRDAGVTADTVGYLETHGTGTRLGDPIEVEALGEVFRAARRSRRGPCVLGSLKPNIGHLDAAAGVAGLIKTVLVLEHGELPPSLHVTEPNPLLGLDENAFVINDRRRPWERYGDVPRRAGVSSFGIGGTNVHVVVEEFARPRAGGVAGGVAGGREQIVLLSGRSPKARADARDRLREALEDGLAAKRIEDVAYSTATGRRHHEYRWFTVAASPAELAEGVPQGRSARASKSPPRTVFVFPGGGTQHHGMARGLDESEPVFRAAIDRCASALGALGPDLRATLYGERPDDSRLRRTSVALPAVFAVGYGLACLLDDWGVRPDAMIGHSLGEYVAACVAGVMPVEDAIVLVHRRAVLIEEAVRGGMLVVNLPEAGVLPLLDTGVTVAAVNAPDSCVVSGHREAVDRLELRLRARGVDCRAIAIDASGHSPLLDPVLDDFRAAFAGVRLSAPRVPYVSNVTGTWITAEQATDPGYWARHLRSTVRFSDGLALLLQRPSAVWVLGSGRSYLSWARRHTADRDGDLLVSALPEPDRAHEDRRELLQALGRHWLGGGQVRWPRVFAAHDVRSVPVPPYPFQRRRHWIPGVGGQWMSAAEAPAAPEAPPDAVDVAGAVGTPPEAPAEDERSHLGVAYAAPAPGLEQALAGAWSARLGIERIGRHDDFFELGGDSLIAVRLAALLRSRLGRDIPAGEVTRHRTVAALAAALEGTPADAAEDAGRQPDLAAIAEATRARLTEVLAGNGAPPDGARLVGARPGEPHLLLTGATGYIGTYLLRELLLQQPLPVLALVRARDAGEGAERIRRALAARALWDPAFEARVTAVPGDLSAPALGWSEETWQRVTARTAAVYHCGAEVNFVTPFDRLEAANSGGTEAVFRLAAMAGPARLHHVSTLGVTYDRTTGPDAVIPERPLEPTVGPLPTGYLQSKWVAERVVDLLRDQGLPASIYRLGHAAGDSTTGHCDPSDLFWRLVRTGLLTGTAPDRNVNLTSMPVDEMARAVVAISLTGTDGVFHVSGPEAPWNRIWEWANALGHPVELVAYDKWVDDLTRRTAGGEQLPLTPVVSMLTRVLPEDEIRRFDTSRGRRLLGRPLPGLDLATFGRTLRRVLSDDPDS